MKTECTKKRYHFQALGRRDIVADFSGGTITSDGGGLLLREVEKRTNILDRFAKCFIDHRDQKRIEHTVQELISQRVYGLILLLNQYPRGLKLTCSSIPGREASINSKLHSERSSGKLGCYFLNSFMGEI